MALFVQVPLGKHIVGQGLELGERELAYGMLYAVYELLAEVVV